MRASPDQRHTGGNYIWNRSLKIACDNLPVWEGGAGQGGGSSDFECSKCFVTMYVHFGSGCLKGLKVNTGIPNVEDCSKQYPKWHTVWTVSRAFM